MDQQGFVDLRQNGHGQGVGENFWPSFTDIMTVVVMIFIITSTVLIIRNWGLVAQLRQTIEAERQARSLAQQSQASNQNLEAQLAQLQSQLSEANIHNLQLVDENKQHKARLNEQAQQLLSLRSDQQRLQSEAQASERRVRVMADNISQLRNTLESQQSEYQQLQTDYKRRGKELNNALAQIDQQEQTLNQRQMELEQAHQEQTKAQQQLVDLGSEYQRLEAKYQKLIRPARTAQGKQVVDVRYTRAGNSKRIELRTPKTSDYRVVSREELQRRLSQLKAHYGKGLYVKIVIPSNSGLSYSEAWEFTRNLLTRYDYYYQ